MSEGYKSNQSNGKSSKSKSSRTHPAGLVSYQIPNGGVGGTPSDNIDTRRYWSISSLNGKNINGFSSARNQHKYVYNTDQVKRSNLAKKNLGPTNSQSLLASSSSHNFLQTQQNLYLEEQQRLRDNINYTRYHRSDVRGGGGLNERRDSGGPLEHQYYSMDSRRTQPRGVTDYIVYRRDSQEYGHRRGSAAELKSYHRSQSTDRRGDNNNARNFTEECTGAAGIRRSSQDRIFAAGGGSYRRGSADFWSDKRRPSYEDNRLRQQQHYLQYSQDFIESDEPIQMIDHSDNGSLLPRPAVYDPAALTPDESFDPAGYEPPPWSRGREPKRYPRSPMPDKKLETEEENIPIPQPPPRSRPKSWTSTFFNAFRSNGNISKTPNSNGHNNNGKAVIDQTIPPPRVQPRLPDLYDRQLQMSESTATLPPMPTVNSFNMLEMTEPDSVYTERKNYGGKQVRFLANPVKTEPSQRFYSLPRFILPYPKQEKPAKSKAVANGKQKQRGRSPSPFNRFVKSLVKGVVHEHPRIGSDGESEEGSGTSEDTNISPGSQDSNQSQNDLVKMRQKPASRKVSKQEEITDLRLPENFVTRQTVSPTLEGPLTRATRRQSLSEIGFGRIDTYTKLDKLGEGTYATVFKGKSRLTENLVALKEIRLEHEEGAPCTAIREVSLLKDLKHANIVTLHDIVHTDKSLTLVFEYLERDLKQYMDDCGAILAINNVKLFLFQMLRGLSYCHARRVLHRDLKPQNLLINEKGELKLADFGLARAKSVPTKTYSNEVVTLWYRPPDVLLGSTEYSTPIDMWGVGCIFYEMSSGRPLFPGSTVEDELHLIFKVLGTPTEETWPGISKSEELQNYRFPEYTAENMVARAPRLDNEGISLLVGFLKFEARKRTSAKAAMQHPYFDSLGPGVHTLADNESILSAPGVQLSRDPGYRQTGYTNNAGKSRRQSMLL